MRLLLGSHSWNDFPVGHAPTDGRNAKFNDRVVSSGFAGSLPVSNVALYDFTRDKIASLIPLAKSWNHPAPVVDIRGAKFKEYCKGQK